jgi:predicted phosphodiesterase
MQILSPSNKRLLLKTLPILLILIAFNALSEEAFNEKKRKGPAQPAPASVPYQAVDIILGQPTSNSVVLSLLRYDHNAPALLVYGTNANKLEQQLSTPLLSKDTPYELTLNQLIANTQYYYQLQNIDNKNVLATGSFHTQRPAGSSFTFTVTADSHLDNNADVPLYLRTLSNIAAVQPDFHIDLGDTFMTGKHANRENATKQYLAQRFYFSQLNSPLFLVIGNHDGEEAKQRKGGLNSLAVWASGMRTRYFPNPQANQFYSGNKKQQENVGSLEDYYAWNWGDALFIVLNPYWEGADNKNSGPWSLSIGKEQYDWLQDTLAKSQATYKLVFIHQLVGGLDRHGRGGVSAIPFGEWGGKNADGSDGFKTYRKGWDQPIHAMLIKYGVNAVFHGHDHLFATQESDGIIYQEVPQPAHQGFSPPRDAVAYGYTTGKILGGSGFMRFKVSAKEITADYIRTDIPRDGQVGHNEEILHHYMISAIN